MRAVGGLLVVGSSLHESKRVELQLRGRAGRQGDPGETLMLYDVNDPYIAVYSLGGMCGSAQVLHMCCRAWCRETWEPAMMRRTQQIVHHCVHHCPDGHCAGEVSRKSHNDRHCGRPVVELKPKLWAKDLADISGYLNTKPSP